MEYPRFAHDFHMFHEVVTKVEYVNGMEITHGYTDIHPSRKEYDVLGAFPRHWTEIREMDEQEIAASRHNAHRAKELARRNYADGLPAQAPAKFCERCNKPVKVQYRYCYRCNNYLQVKARIA